jgi:hypothetical protein
MLVSEHFPVSSWLARFHPRIDSGTKRTVSRPVRFFQHLQMQADVVSGASRRLRNLTVSPNSHRADELALLVRCRETARALDEELLQALRMTVITPLDCEDLKRMSARLFRIVDGLAGAGYATLATGNTEERLVVVQDRIVSGAESIAAAIADLGAGAGIEDSTRTLWERTREAGVLLRQARAEALNGASDPVLAMAQEAVAQRLAAVLGLFREINRLIGKAKLKAG